MPISTFYAVALHFLLIITPVSKKSYNFVEQECDFSDASDVPFIDMEIIDNVHKKESQPIFCKNIHA